MMTKKLVALLATALLVFAGCSNKVPANQPVDVKSIDDTGNKVEVSDDGRQTGGYFEGKVKEKMSSSFFDFTVIGYEQVETFDSLTPAEGNILLKLDVEVTNTFGEDIPMFSSDFFLEYGDGDEDYTFANEEIAGVMPGEYTLADKETGTYIMVFEVPADKTYSFTYMEVYEDDFVGNYLVVAL